MRVLARWLGRIVLMLVVLVLLLLSPVAYTELACTGAQSKDAYQPVITDPEWQRAESRTLMTYPEWHIVHAYDDYAKVIVTGDPHDFAFARAIGGFWGVLCPLMERSSELGEVTGESKTTIYTIGVSFTAELLAKALYEETIGRVVSTLRGSERASLDNLSAKQAAAYATFLQQVPWYEWDFLKDKAELKAAKTTVMRDRERSFALGLEYGAKAAYARVIAAAVDGIGADQVRLRSVVKGLTPEQLRSIDGVDVIDVRTAGVVIETDRYRAFTSVLQRLAQAGAAVVEIAGNDEILFTATSKSATATDALYSFKRQGYDDWRHLMLVPVSQLASTMRDLGELRLEHVHDY